MSSDRAAVAREVLTEIANAHRELGFTAIVDVMESWRDEHYPAPPAPETVTVTVGRRAWTRDVDGWWVHNSDISHDVCGPRSTIGEMCDRIASDARVIRELERSRDGWDADARREAGNVLYWRGERDRAIDAIQERDARIAELEQLLQDQPRLLYDSMWQAIDRMGDAVGTLTGPGSNCHVTATRVCETIETLKSERDAALRALERERAANDTRIEYGTEPRGVVISGTLEEGA